jgi:hypothetical protein
VIDQKSSPESWALLVQDLDDLREHLESLVNQMCADGRIDDEDYAVQIAHAYAHLNRAWNSRNSVNWDVDAEWEAMSRFPEGLDPVG